MLKGGYSLPLAPVSGRVNVPLSAFAWVNPVGECVSNASSDRPFAAIEGMDAMRDFHDAKLMAKALKSALDDRQVSLTHSEALEIVAAQFGYKNWNILAAVITENTPDDIFQVQEAIPIIRIFEEAKAREFYLGFLGFNLDWVHRFGDNAPLYAQVSRAGLKLHLSEHHGDASPGSRTFVPMRGVEALQKELRDKDYTYNNPGINDTPWGREVTVTDPFSNRITFAELSRAVA